MALCGALCYGALAARYPDAGGGYVYLREAFGPRVAFLYGWKCFLVMDPGITAALALGIRQLRRVHRAARRRRPRGSWPSSAIVGLAAVHMRRRPPWHPRADDARGAEAGAHRRPRRAWRSRARRQLAALRAVRRAACRRAAVRAGAGRRPRGGVLLVRRMVGGHEDRRRSARPDAHHAARAAARARDRDAGLRRRPRWRSCTSSRSSRSVPGRRSWRRSARCCSGRAGGTVVARDRGRLRARQPRRHADAGAARVLRDGARRALPRRGGRRSSRGSARPPAPSAHRRCWRRCSSLFGTFDSIVAYFIFITVAFIALTVAAVFVLRRRDPALRAPGHPWPALDLPVHGRRRCSCCSRVNNPLQAALGVAVVALGVPGLPRAARRVALAAFTDGDSLMTWIRTIPFDDDETLRKAREAQQALYPIEYARADASAPPGHRRDRRVALAHPRRDVPRVRGVRRADVARPAAHPPPARDDHDGRVGDEPVPVLTGVARRVSA